MVSSLDYIQRSVLARDTETGDSTDSVSQMGGIQKSKT